MQLEYANIETLDRNELINLLARLTSIEPVKLQPEVDIYHELGIDSLSALRVVAEVEAHYGLTFDEAEAADVRTVGQFMDMVEAAIALEA